MPVKKINSKEYGYRLIGLCVGALALGSAIPLIVLYNHGSYSHSALAAGEFLGAAVLAYVFILYLLKK